MRVSIRAWILAAAGAAALVAPATSRAALVLPGGDTYLDGTFDGMTYGGTGAAYVTPLLYLGDLAATDAPAVQAGATGLVYSYVLGGLGTPAATIEYVLSNIGTETFLDLRFLVNVQADGSSSFLDFVGVTFGPGAAGEPDQFQVGDFSVDPLAGLLATNDATDGSNACGVAACDADLALQWDLPELAPGAIWRVRVALAEDGSSLSSRFLQATSADTQGTVLTFSGVASVVPEPGTGLLLAAGLAVLARRRIAPAA